MINKTSDSEDILLLIILIPSTILSTIAILFVILILTLFVVMRICVAKKTLDEDHSNEDPTYDDIVPCHQDNIIIPLEENAAYGHVTRTTKI